MSKSERDQNLAAMRDGLPPVWWSIYQGCLQAGFTKDQALVLTQTSAAATMSHQGFYLKPPPDDGKKGDDS